MNYASLLHHPELLLDRLKIVVKDKHNAKSDRDYWRNKSKQQDIEIAMLKQQCYKVTIWDKIKYLIKI